MYQNDIFKSLWYICKLLVELETLYGETIRKLNLYMFQNGIFKPLWCMYKLLVEVVSPWKYNPYMHYKSDNSNAMYIVEPLKSNRKRDNYFRA